MSTQICPNCQQPLRPGAAFCRSCGSAVEKLTCPHCQRPIGGSDRFCEGCGTPLSHPSAQPEPTAAQKSLIDKRAQPNNWRKFTNAWYGFTLDLPPGWFARTGAGVTLIAPDAQGYVCVILRPLQVKKGTTAEMLARHIAGVQRKAFTSFSAWSDPPLKEEAPNAQTLVMRYKGIYQNVPIEGVLVVRVKEELALVRGFQAPGTQMEKLAQQMQQIMTSLRFSEPLSLQSYRETNEGAFTGSIPRGWSISANVTRSSDASRTPVVHLRATNPPQTSTLEIPPIYEQYSEQPLPLMMGGGISFRPVQTAEQYIQLVTIPTILRSQRDARIETIEHRPDLSELATLEAARDDHFGLGTICDVASVTYTSLSNNVTSRTKDFVQISHIRAAQTWTARISAILRALEAQFEEQEALMAGIVEAIQPDEQWKKREVARSDQFFLLARQRLARVQSQAAGAIQNLHQANLDIAENMRAGVQHRNAQFSTLQQDMDRIIAGYQYVYDPIDQQVYDVPVGTGQLWAGDGSVYRTHAGLTPPKLGLHRLEPLA